jgi:glucokinase
MTQQNLVLLADIGGTNARFALSDGVTIRPATNLQVAEHASLPHAIEKFLISSAAKGKIAAACLAVAGAVENNRSFITNSGWTVDGAELQAAMGCQTVHLLNDFEALAWSLPSLAPADVFALGGSKPRPDAPMVVLGPGTGFGAAAFIPRGRASFAIAGEMGHSTLPAASEDEDKLLSHLRRRFGHVSVERALSGPGLENIYEALASGSGAAVPRRDAAAITQEALSQTCATSEAALDMFCRILGSIAGNLALNFCARGGVFIGGGITPRIAEYLQRSEFRARFESKGRYRAYLADIPTSVIMRPDATFVGLQQFQKCVA